MDENQRLAALAPKDTVIRLSHELRGQAKVYPTVDVLALRSRVLEALKAVDMKVSACRTSPNGCVRLWRHAVGRHPAEPDPANDRLAAATRAQGAELFHTSRSSRRKPTATAQKRQLGAAEAWRAPARKSSTADMTTCRIEAFDEAAVYVRSGQTAAVNLRLAPVTVDLSTGMIERIDIQAE